MSRLPAPPRPLPFSVSWRPWLAPVRVSWLRAIVEGIGGVIVFAVLALLTLSGGQVQALSTFFAVIADAWLVLWPAWRMAIVRRDRWWRRLIKGTIRGLVVGVALAVVASIVASSLPALATQTHSQAYGWAASGAQTFFLFLCARALIVVVTALRRRVRRRLRWQLTWSYLTVIVITFLGLTALGSAVVFHLFLQGTTPNAATMAASVREELLSTVSASGPIDTRRAQSLFDRIESGEIALRGEPPLAFTNPSRFAPVRVLLLRPDGGMLASSMSQSQATVIHLARAATPLPAAVWRGLRAAALRGETGRATQAITVTSSDGYHLSGQLLYGAAPLRDAAGHTSAVVVVETAAISSLFGGGQFLAVAVAIFVFSGFALILAAALPILGISMLFGLFFARGLTRRLEAVSRVTTAIAGGDLTRRAPVNAENEVGQLAGSVNRMAEHLEAAMGESQRARVQAENALRARQELVASISHELRTPLAIVRAHLDSLAMSRAASVAPVGSAAGASSAAGAWNSEVTIPETTLHALQSETERLSALVDDLFSLSRAETGVITVRHEPVDTAALIDEIATLMRPLAQREGLISLIVEAPPGLPDALADPDRLRQILSNLIRNAVRYTPEGGIIVLSAAQESSWIVIAVADTGAGIAPEHLPHIFDRFYRVDQARTRELGGAGLGLAIVKEFVELMGGQVTVESQLGEGSCFRVYLPIAQSSATA